MPNPPHPKNPTAHPNCPPRPAAFSGGLSSAVNFSTPNQRRISAQRCVVLAKGKRLHFCLSGSFRRSNHSCCFAGRSATSSEPHSNQIPSHHPVAIRPCVVKIHTKAQNAHIQKQGLSCRKRLCLCSEAKDTLFRIGRFRAN
jgi:hypothetical protein